MRIACEKRTMFAPDLSDLTSNLHPSVPVIFNSQSVSYVVAMAMYDMSHKKLHLSGSFDLLVISLKLTAEADVYTVAILLLYIYLKIL
jgi:hypothetical protein